MSTEKMTSDKVPSRLAVLLEAKRKEFGYRSIAELAERRMGMSRQQLHRATRKRPKVETLRRIAEGIDMKVIALLEYLDIGGGAGTEHTRGPTERGQPLGPRKKARRG